MVFFKDIKYFVEGIADANRELAQGIKEVFTETKRDIISDLKHDAPAVGKTVEKVDRVITTTKNASEQLPELTVSTVPRLNINKQLKSIKEVTKTKVDDKIDSVQHLKVNRAGYSHHALSLNSNQVIHYQDGVVKVETIQQFAKGASIYKVNTPRLYPKDEVITRAYSRMGEQQYNLIFNNCEHFVKWALNGE